MLSVLEVTQRVPPTCKDRFPVLGKRFFQQRDPNLFHVVTVRKGSTSAQAIALVVGEAGKVVVDNDMFPLAVFVPESQIEKKREYLIILVLVFTHHIKISKYSLVYIQHP